MMVYCVMEDDYGFVSLSSIWSTMELAEKELLRLGERFYSIREVEIDKEQS